MSKHTIFLNGGLGNQLFQLMYGLKMSSRNPLMLDWSNSTKRFKVKSDPDLLLASFPRNVKTISARHDSILLSVAIRIFFHMSIQEGSYFKRKSTIKKVIILATLQYFAIRYRESVGISFGQKNYKIGKKGETNWLHFGYFQSAESISVEGEEFLARFVSENASSFLDSLNEESRISEPLVVHVRLGDYVDERQIGLLSENYFSDAIEYAITRFSFKEIWVFSDDEANCLSVIPSKYLSISKVKSTKGMTSEQALLALGFGKGYVLSNSTFSWFGAYLRREKTSFVLVPDPWFATLTYSDALIPSRWTKIPSSFRQIN